MRNFEKYEKEIKELNYCFGVDKYINKASDCKNIDCQNCIFLCDNIEKIKWLYQEYNPKAQLTIEEIEDILKDKYPNGIEVVEQ